MGRRKILVGAGALVGLLVSLPDLTILYRGPVVA